MYLDPRLADDAEQYLEEAQPGQYVAVVLDEGGDPVVALINEWDDEAVAQPQIVIESSDVDFAHCGDLLRERDDRHG